jgi:hypothetical protein
VNVFGGLAVCEECHAVVNAEALALHEEWHSFIAGELMWLTRQVKERRAEK